MMLAATFAAESGYAVMPIKRLYSEEKTIIKQASCSVHGGDVKFSIP